MTTQVEPEYYFSQEYNSKNRFMSYWHQIDEILSFNPKIVLEVGIGNSFMSNYLNNIGIKVITLDLDSRLYPDAVGNLHRLPFADKSFDIVACFEVLEHIPYIDFPIALKEFHRVSNHAAIFSIPDCSRAYRINIQFPFIGELRVLVSLPSIRAPVHNFDGQHYWEINKADYSLNEIITKIRFARFKIIKTYRIFEFPYHRFFVLSI